MTIETTTTETAAIVNHAEIVISAIGKMRTDDGQAETTAVNFVRSTLAALLAGAMSIEGVAASVIAAFGIVTPKGKAPKATVSGVKNGFTARGSSAQLLAKRMETADFAFRNHNAAPEIVAAFLAGDVKVKSVNALRVQLEAAVNAAAAAALAALPVDDETPVETVATETTPAAAETVTTPAVATLAELFATLCERVAMSSAADDDAIAAGVMMLDAAVATRAATVKLATAA